jgi:hypothetical protein
MAKNLGRKFATMDEDERREFAGKEEEGSRELPAELDFDEPRKEENLGPQYGSIKAEVADPDHRDGMSALLDDEQHRKAVKDEGRRRARREDQSK